MDENSGIYEEPTSPQTLQPGRFRTLPVSRLRTGRFQPRAKIDKGSKELRRLKASIREQGILNPLLVAKGENTNSYDVIGGERRLTAAKELGMDEVPVRDMSDLTEADQAEAAVADNTIRKDMNGYETAQAYQKLIDVYGFAPAELARRTGISKSKLSRLLSVLKAPEWLQEICRDHDIPYSVADALKKLAEVLPEAKVKRAASRYCDKQISKLDIDRMYKRAVKKKAAEATEDPSGDGPLDLFSDLIVIDDEKRTASIKSLTLHMDNPLTLEQGQCLVEQIKSLGRIIKKMVEDTKKRDRCDGATP